MYKIVTNTSSYDIQDDNFIDELWNVLQQSSLNFLTLEGIYHNGAPLPQSEFERYVTSLHDKLVNAQNPIKRK